MLAEDFSKSFLNPPPDLEAFYSMRSYALSQLTPAAMLGTKVGVLEHF